MTCRYGHTEVLRYFLAEGAEVSVVNNEGRTALHWSVRNGHIESLSGCFSIRGKSAW